MAGLQLDAEFDDKFYDEIKKKELARLNELSALANKQADLADSTTLLQNTSLKELSYKTVDTVVAILKDLSAGKPLLDVFLAPDRVTYVGVLLLFVALCFYLVDISR